MLTNYPVRLKRMALAVIVWLIQRTQNQSQHLDQSAELKLQAKASCLNYYRSLMGKTMFSAKAILLTLFFLTTASSVQAKELVFLNWADYMDPEIILEFKQRTGITVKQSYFDSDTARDELLLETEAQDFDIALLRLWIVLSIFA